MNDLEKYYNDIPIGRENAVTYAELCLKWECRERKVRHILHELSGIDTGDKYILIRSSHGKGFYKTDNIAEIERYATEICNRAKNTFIPLKKIQRVINEAKTPKVPKLPRKKKKKKKRK